LTNTPTTEDVLKIATYNGYGTVSAFQIIELVEIKEYIPPYVSAMQRWREMTDEEKDECQKDLIKILWGK